MKRIIAFIIIATSVFINAIAMMEIPDFNFLHYTTENGLPSNCIRDIRQDDDGFMWFATDGGLVRFDGVRCSVFLPDAAKDRLSLDVYVLSLCMHEGTLIVGTASNIYSFDKKTETLVALPLKYPEGVSPLHGTGIRNICNDLDGNLWISTEKKGVYLVDKELNVVQAFKFPELDNYMSSLYCDNENNIWGVSTSKFGGVYRYDRKAQSFKQFPLKINGKEMTIPALALFEDSNGDFWLGSWTHGLIGFNPHTGETRRALRGWSERIFHIHSISQYSPSRLLVGSEQGLALYDIPTSSHVMYNKDELNRRSLSNQFVYPVIKDREGGIWVGTFYGGVNYMALDTKKVKTWNHSRFRNSVSGNVVSCLAEGLGDDIWIGSDDGGVCRFSQATGLFKSYSLSKEGDDNVHSIFVDGKSIWVGTYSDGAGVLDSNTGKWNPIPLEGAGNDYNCYAIFKDTHGSIWMGADNCLNRYDSEQHMFVRHRNLASWIVGITEDKAHRLWISTQGMGVYLYNPMFDSWVNYRTGKEHGNLPHNHVNQIYEDETGIIYAATVNGVASFDEKTNSFHRMETNLPDNMVESIAKVGDILWLATPVGLAKVFPDGNYTLFTTHDGLISNQFSTGASLLSSSGLLFLGTADGLCSLSPSEMKGNTYVPPVVFTGLEVVNNKVEVGDEILPESLNTIDKLTLSHSDHTFSVYFAALSYANPECNNYMYRLEGFDKDWINAGKENRATYSNLPPGKYKLHVKASNNDDVWNEEGVSLPIEVLPMWYATWWMRLVYLSVIVGLVVMVLRHERRRREKFHREELERISSNKEKEVYRTKLSFFTIVAHEIRTPVSLIIGPIEKVMDAAKSLPASVRGDIEMIHSNAKRLLSLVNQMLDFKKVEESAFPTEFRKVELVPLIESVVERFRPSVEHKGASLSAVYPSGSLYADVCPESFTKLVSNLLNNARKFTKDQIILKCEVREETGRLIISVSDNGIGIKKENLEKIFTPFYQILDNINESRGGTGLGLSIVKSVAESHGGTVSVESELGKGSVFIVNIPLHQENVVPEIIEEKEPTQDKDFTETRAAGDGLRPLILVVDDNIDMQTYISKNLSDNYDVLLAENGKDALELLKSRNVAMIVCDWMMPVMDGLTLLRKVREDKELSHIPFIMLTAKTDINSKIESMKQGADAYIEKPFSMAFLTVQISNLMEMRKTLYDKYYSNPLAPVSSLASHPEENEFLCKLNLIIEENIANPELNVDFLASELCIGRTSLFNKIKALSNVPPNKLIQITRLKKAAELLLEGKKSIKDISASVGFKSESYFSKCFSQQFGVSPAKFTEDTNRSKKE